MIESRRVAAMGAHATVTIVGGGSGVMDAVLRELERLEGLWSRFLPGSDLSRLNLADGAPVRVDPATVGLLHVMGQAIAETGGAFDPTLLPALVDAGYAVSMVDPAHSTALPPTAHAGGAFGDTIIDGFEVTLPAGLTVDAGGIGKGYAADRLTSLARVRGASGAMVEIAGDLVVFGEAPQPGGWVIGIEDPREPARHRTTVRLAEGAVATSGTRKRRWMRDGAERHHLIDPRTGASARDDIDAVTVIAGSGARAEALAKYAFVHPIGDTLAWLPTRNAAGFIVTADGAVHATSTWEDFR
ncbi:MAG TPA: FAD:protein FMN transferase [Pseudolysinimonas sp.]|jgi:thiamine biosynthesis lipoprotein|nr:FAD:protein FMN transferase [Pseudolysinimonas sp.]